MSEMDKYYQILGLNPGASEKEIVEAYKVLVKVWHPDRFPDDPNIQKIATEKIKEIDEAFKQLLIWAGGSPEKVKEIPEPQLEVRTERPETSGSIIIQTKPEDAVIVINEQPVGMGSYERRDLPIGLYKVRVIKDGYEIWEQEIDIKGGGKEEVVAKLKLKEPESGQVWKDPYTEMEFVYVKGGSFEMGDTFGDGKSDEQPVHKVFLDDFYIGKYQVTQGQWEKVMGNNPSYYSVEGNDYPVESVSWEDTQDYIRTLKQKTGKSYRLPTEAEWEYAARDRGKKEKWSGTSSENSVEVYVWFKDNSDNKTHPVGQKKANGLGLHDMSGNVWEWVQDWYMESYSKVSKDNNPVNSSRGDAKIIRGGSWSDNLNDLRNSNRESMATYKKSVVVGFRLVLPAQGERPRKEEKEQPITTEGKTYSTPQAKMTHIMEVQAQIASEAKKYDIPTPSLHKPLYKPPQVQGDANQPNATARTAKAGPTGIGGWLMLLVLGMMVLGPLVGAGRLATDLTSAERQYPQITNLEVWKTYKSVAWCAFILFAAVSFYGGWGLVRGKEWSVVSRAKAILWIIGPIGSIVLGLGIPIAIFGEAAPVEPRFIGALIAIVFWAAIWTAYLSKSKRVRNTYGGPGSK